MDFRLGKAAPALLLLCSCGSPDAEAVVSFEGRWRYYEGFAACQEPQVSHPLFDIDVEIAPVSENWVEFRAGPRCHFTLEVSGKSASLRTEQTCEMSLRTVTAFAAVSSFTLEALGEGQLRSTANGSANLLVGGETIPCERFAFEGGRLTQRGPIPN
jgi:hypothetical protein